MENNPAVSMKYLTEKLPCDPAISLLSIYPEEMKTYTHTKILHEMFIATSLKIVKKWKKPNVHQLRNV